MNHHRTEPHLRIAALSSLFLALVALLTTPYAATAADARRSRVLFDESHAQQFLIGKQGDLDLSGLAALFSDQGYKVSAGRSPLDADTLSDVDILVISGAFAPLGPSELKAVNEFLTRGGRLAVMLHIPFPLAPLLRHLGVAVSNGVVHEQENLLDHDDVNFRVEEFSEHEFGRGLENFNLYGGWALMNTRDNAAVVARSGPRAWVDLNGDKTLTPGDAVQAFGLIVAGTFGEGRFVVFGDDAIFQNRFLSENNATLASRLISWLTDLSSI